MGYVGDAFIDEKTAQKPSCLSRVLHDRTVSPVPRALWVVRESNQKLELNQFGSVPSVWAGFTSLWAVVDFSVKASLLK